MGVPTKIKKPFEINALPIRAYVKIWNEFFRDENVDNNAIIETGSKDILYEQSKEKGMQKALNDALNGVSLLPVNKFHDYFTSCLPYPQRGPEVTLPMQGNAEVRAYKGLPTEENETDLLIDGFNIGATPSTKKGTLNQIVSAKNTSPVQFQGAGIGGNGGNSVYLAADLSTITATTINELRKAVAVQQYYEALARGGSRYREQVQALWNVVISDKTVQIRNTLAVADTTSI